MRYSIWTYNRSENSWTKRHDAAGAFDAEEVTRSYFYREEGIYAAAIVDSDTPTDGLRFRFIAPEPLVMAAMDALVDRINGKRS
ncbi:MAG: hypothetical protein ACYC26_11075 [Phycisphaerales bacterium]